MNLNEIEKKKLYKNIIKIAVPIALQSLIGTSLSLVDNLMVGRLGETELAAVGIGVQIYFIYWMFVFGFSSGCSTFMAQFWGAKDLKNIRKTLGFALTVTFSIGILFFLGATFFSESIVKIFTNIPEIIPLAAEYTRVGAFCFIFVALTLPFSNALRATHQAKIPLYISIFAFSVNTLLNYMFIFGKFGAPELGVAGAALATVIARLLETSMTLFVVFGLKNTIAGKIKEYFGWQKEHILRIIRTSLPTTCNEVFWGVGTSLYTAAYARIGVTEFAAIRAGDIIYNLFIMAAFSIGDAALILIGQKLGQGKLNEAYPMGKIFIKIAVITGLVLGGMVILLAKPMLSLFNFTPEGEMYGFRILMVYGLTMFLVMFNGLNVVGILRSGGDTKFAMFAEIGTIYLIGVPAAFITGLVLNWPIYFVVLAIKFEEVVKAFIMLKRFRSKKWVRSVIGDINEPEEPENPVEKGHSSPEGGPY